MYSILLVVVFSTLTISLGAVLESASFIPPYTDVDTSGTRVVNEYWRTSGDTDTLKNFVRLTPDRQSKRGSIWMKNKIGADSIASTVKFRIHGQGKQFFGDGLAVWFVDKPFYNEGDLHGGNEKFKGVSIIFDTFKNTENLSAHRDITVLVNDGEKTYEWMKDHIQGCNTSPTARYHNARADFEATDASRALISIESNKLRIQIDALNTGGWQECTTIVSLDGLASNWLKDSYMGVTASTGQLGDNHDLISVQTDTDVRRVEAKVANEKRMIDEGLEKLPESRQFRQNPNGPVEARLLTVENALNDLMTRMQKNDINHEHAIVAAEEKIRNLIGKLADREDAAERRIEALESRIQDEVGNLMHDMNEDADIKLHAAIDERLTDHEAELKQDLQSTVDEIAVHIDKQVDTMDTHRKDTEELISSVALGDGGAWKYPFYFLLFVVLGGGVYIFMFIKDVKKTVNQGLGSLGYTRQHCL